jgi:hypothetical protein
MIWVAVFGGIALAGLITFIAYAVWLAHKAADVLSEVQVVADRTGQLFDLLSQIQPPDRSPGSPYRHSDLTVVGSTDHGRAT